MTLQVLSGLLLVCLGLLLGSTWTTQALQHQLRRQAEERRRLNEEWLAVRTARWALTECPRCGIELSRQDRHITPTVVEDRLDHD